ncbi:uncharacterized protein [Rutidosis leptorrhynchoides]|uniref:uncharacterized protein n=1 Tax=Rutidosis leptorrhynchoides TaxID=125765 RepID=UPI003A99A6FC
MVHQEGFDLSFSVKDLIHHNGMVWPTNWLNQFSQLTNIVTPILSNEQDVIKWRDSNGNLKDFSNTPKHAFIMWLLMGENLKTQDKPKHWEVAANCVLVCSSCDQVPDSHDHLFFTCSFSRHVWHQVNKHMEFPIFSDSWKDFSLIVSPFAKRNIGRIIVIKLLFVASVYFLWQERNNRIFKKKTRSIDQVYKAIYSKVWLKLMTIKWRLTPKTLRLKADWKVS